MNVVLISLIVLAIVGIVIFGICFLAMKDYKFTTSVSKEKIEVASESNSKKKHK